MLGLRVKITRFVEERQPHVVEFELLDARGKRHFFIEKVPVVSAEELGADSNYPRDGIIACRMIKTTTDGGWIKVDTDTPWRVASVAGETLFDVTPDQLIELEDLP